MSENNVEKKLTEKQKKKIKNRFNGFKNNAYSEEEMQKVFKRENKIMGKMNNKILNGFIEDVKIFFKMLKDYFTKKYTKVPVGTIMAIVGSLLYVFAPLDVISDFLPFVGYLDDASVITLCMTFVKGDIEGYKDFLKDQKE